MNNQNNQVSQSNQINAIEVVEMLHRLIREHQKMSSTLINGQVILAYRINEKIIADLERMEHRIAHPDNTGDSNVK